MQKRDNKLRRRAVSTYLNCADRLTSLSDQKRYIAQLWHAREKFQILCKSRFVFKNRQIWLICSHRTFACQYFRHLFHLHVESWINNLVIYVNESHYNWWKWQHLITVNCCVNGSRLARRKRKKKNVKRRFLLLFTPIKKFIFDFAVKKICHTLTCEKTMKASLGTGEETFFKPLQTPTTLVPLKNIFPSKRAKYTRNLISHNVMLLNFQSNCFFFPCFKPRFIWFCLKMPKSFPKLSRQS